MVEGVTDALSLKALSLEATVLREDTLGDVAGTVWCLCSEFRVLTVAFVWRSPGALWFGWYVNRETVRIIVHAM